MSRPLCSIVMVSFNRGHLLRKSVETYNRLHFPLDRLEVIVVDDGSTDDTASVCELFDPRIDVSYVKLRKPDGQWRDCAVNINRGLRLAKGSVVLATHPEVLVGRDSVTACCDLATDWVYACCKPYYTREVDLQWMETVNWVDEGPLVFRKAPGFYDPIPGGHPDYHPHAIERIPEWRSWVFGGHNRETWRRLGGHPVTQHWGSIDVLYSDRRRVLGIKDRTALDENTYCAHLWHPAPRDIDKTMREAATFSLQPDRLVWPAIDELW